MVNKKNILVTGANGLVGYQTCEFFKKKSDYNVIGISRSSGKHVDQQMDLSDFSVVKDLSLNIKPDVILHTAAISRTDECEKEPTTCYEVNVGSTKNIIELFPYSKMVFFSTYAVYNTPQGNCNETCILSPVNTYIKTKIESEKILTQTKDFIILRPSVIFGFADYNKKSKNYFMQLIDNVRENHVMKSPMDQYFNPILVDIVIEILYNILENNYSGIFNLGCNESISKYEFNKLLLKKFGFDESLLIGIESSDLKVKRPSNGTISSLKIQKTINYSIPPLSEMIEQLFNLTNIQVKKYVSE